MYLLPILLTLTSMPAQGMPELAPVQTLSPERAVLLSLADADKQAKEDQPFLQYLYYPGTDTDFEIALRFHVNLISSESQFAYPTRIVPGLWRVDRRDYGWRRQQFDNLAEIDPYFHRRQAREVIRVRKVEVVEDIEVVVQVPYQAYSGYGYQTYYRSETRVEQRRRIVEKEERKHIVESVLYVPQGAGQLASLALLLQSKQPIARADWFLVQGARQTSLTNRSTGAGYYDWLGLRDQKDFFRLIGFDERAAIRTETEVRAVVGNSGVTQANRGILRQGATTGALWRTFEVEDQSGRGVAINELRRNELVSVASEFYGFLPNGLVVTFLADDKGVRQDSVPDKIAGNRSDLNVGNDTRVHVNMACMQCHAGNVLQPIRDDVREVYLGKLGVTTNDKKLALELRRQYGASLDRLLARDRLLYQDAFTLVTNKTPQQAASIYSKAFTNYAYRQVTLAQAAQELGVSTGAYKKALVDSATRLGRGDFRTDPFLPEAPLPIPRLNFEDAFQDTQDALYGVLPLEDQTDRGQSHKSSKRKVTLP